MKNFTFKALTLLGFFVLAFAAANYAQVVSPVTVTPATATANDQLTLTFKPSVTCEVGTAKSLLGSTEVRIHSGVKKGINGGRWQNVVAWDGTGGGGQNCILTKVSDDEYTITFIPAVFYGVTAPDTITEIDCVFNSGLSTPGPWDKEGKEGYPSLDSCHDIFVPLPVSAAGVHGHNGMQALVVAFPNPFTTTFNVDYSISKSSDVTIALSNLLGQVVKSTAVNAQTPGLHHAEFDVNDLSNGIYFYRLEAGNFIKTGKIVKK